MWWAWLEFSNLSIILQTNVQAIFLSKKRCTICVYIAIEFKRPDLGFVELNTMARLPPSVTRPFHLGRFWKKIRQNQFAMHPYFLHGQYHIYGWNKKVGRKVALLILTSDMTVTIFTGPFNQPFLFSVPLRGKQVAVNQCYCP